jgi:hypothetical protein
VPTVLLIAGLSGIPGAVAVWAATGVAEHPTRWLLVGLLGPVAVLGVFGFLGVVLMRHDRFAVDATGWWWFHDGAFDVVAWDSLAAAGVYCAGGTPDRPASATLELFPRGAVDRADPRLWQLVRDGDPPATGAPRLRYRVRLTRMINFLPEVEAACLRWAPPGLWFGRLPQPAGYAGRPDRRGHRRRQRERAQGIPSDGVPLPAPAAGEGPVDAGPVGASRAGLEPADAVPAGAGPVSAGPTDARQTGAEPADAVPGEAVPRDTAPPDPQS